MSTLAQHSPTVSPGLLRDYTTTITILEHLSDAVFILSADGSIQYANHNATDMLRLPIEMLLGKKSLRLPLKLSMGEISLNSSPTPSV